MRASSRASAVDSRRFSSKVKRGAPARRSRPVFVAIGMGANVGDTRRALRVAAQSLFPFLRNPKISPLYRTSPVGEPSDQPDYLNAVITGRTTHSALAL